MPYRIDLFAVFIFLGMVQAVFLSFFFFSAENRVRQFNVFYGCLLISIVACLLEIFLMYTGYIINALHFAEFSEPFALLIGPFLFLYVITLAHGPVKRKVVFAHMVFPVVYSILLIPFLISSADVKYNAWIGAYHPDMPFRAVTDYPDRFEMTHWHTELVLLSLAVYVIWSSVVIYRVFQEKNESFWKPASTSLNALRNAVIQFLFFTLLIVIVKLLNRNDTGDHLFAAVGSLLIYLTSFSVIRDSGFFRQSALNEQVKYKTSSLTPDQQNELLNKLRKVMDEEKPFKRSDFSQPELARQLGVSVHVLSQAINDGAGKSFFEWLAEYRVNEAKQLLSAHPNFKVEEIAEQVGYNSKSSFNTAFKKITGTTPSEYRDKQGG